MEMLEKARGFIYKNARPLDVARWNYLFENGDSTEVMKYLLSYQNEDGGFGHALEPDCWNEKSTPPRSNLEIATCFKKLSRLIFPGIALRISKVIFPTIYPSKDTEWNLLFSLDFAS